MLELWARLQWCCSPSPRTCFSKAGRSRQLSHFPKTKKQLWSSLAHFQGTSSPKLRWAGLQTVLRVFKSLSWRLCDWGYLLLNHCKKKLSGSCLLVSAFTPSLPEQGSAACPSDITIGLGASSGDGPQLPPCPSPFLCLLSLLKTVCCPPEKKQSNIELLLGAVMVGGSGVSKEGVDEVKDRGLTVNTSGGCKPWESSLSSGPSPFKSPLPHTPCKLLLAGPELICLLPSGGKTPCNPYGISLHRLF